MLPKLLSHRRQIIDKYFFLLLVTLLLSNVLLATPQYNLYDPAIVHTAFGADKFYVDRQKSELSVWMAPMYQHTSSASQQLGSNQPSSQFSKNKVPMGNRLGRWNMLALYYNPADTITGGTALGKARTQILAAEATAGTPTAKSVTESTGKNFNLDGTDDNSTAGTIAEVLATYEKFGLRGQVSFDTSFGLGLTVKGGVVDYRQTPTFKPLLTTTAASSDSSGSTTTTSGFTNEPAKTIFSQLNTQEQREAIAKDFDLSLREEHATELEDIHIDVHWCMPFKRYEKEDFVYSLVPYLAVGAWIPTGAEVDQNKPFSASSGNEGFPGATIEFGLNFDFPKMLQVGFGGGAAFYAEKTLNNVRVPTSKYQVGMIPWKTSISKRPGTLWYFNASMKAEDFNSGFSFYFDYIFTQHNKDSIELKEINPLRAPKFDEGVTKMINDSVWKAQHYNAAIKYDITSQCSFSFGVQGCIGGVRIFRVTTVMGTFSVRL